MNIKDKIYMKHTMHHAGDQYISFEIDLLGRTVKIEMSVLDTLLLQLFLQRTLLEIINEGLEKIGNIPKIETLSSFNLKLNLDGKVNLSIRLCERSFEPKDPTLIMSVME